MMNYETRSRICREIVTEMRRGITIDDELQFFAASTYGVGPEQFEASVTDPDFEGREPLLTLLLTPDDVLRCAVERHLAGEAADPVDEDAITAAAAAEIDCAAVTWSGDGASGFTLPVDRDSIEILVAKLYLQRSLDSLVNRRLGESLPKGAALRARVRLRCSGESYNEEQRGLIALFIASAASLEEDFTASFDLLLSSLAGCPKDGRPPEYHLARQLQTLIRLLQELRQFERRRDRYGMEYLLMQRYRIPGESEEELVIRLRLLSGIFAVLGIPEAPATKTGDLLHFGPAVSARDMELLIKTLS